MRTLLKRLYRERRRLSVVAAVTFLGGFLAFYKSSTVVFGIPMPILAGLAFMFGLTAFLMGLVVLFPSIRHSAESVALSIPVLSLMGVFSSTDEGGLSTSTSIYGLLLAYLFMTVYAGAWVDKYLPRRPHTFRSRALSKLRREELWPYLTVTPDTVDTYGSENTISMEWIEPGVSFREVERSGDLAKVEEVATIEANEANSHYRKAFVVADATENAPVSSGYYEVKLSNGGPGTYLETVREFDRVTIRARLFTWIDDAFGRQDDLYIQQAERAVQSSQAA